MLNSLTHFFRGDKKTKIQRRKIGAGFESLEGRRLMAGLPLATDPQRATAADIGAAAADGNDTRSGALNIGSFSGVATSVTRTGSVGTTSDNQDYYRFTLTQSNHVRITLSGLSQDLDFELQNSSGGLIGSPRTNSGTASEFGSYSLPAGTYYIRIFKGVSSAVSNYSLGLTFGDDSIGAAFNLGSFGAGTQTISRSGNITGNDTQDFYKVTLTASNRFRVMLTGLSADLDFQLQNSSGQTLMSGVNSSTTSEDKAILLSPGTYYVRVFKGVSTASSNYLLTLKAGDDSFADANRLGQLSNGVVITRSSSIVSPDLNDYYQFTLNSNLQKRVQIQLSGLSADLDFELLNSSGQRIGSVANNGGTTSESKTYTLSNSTYYIRVFKGVSTASSNYTLRITPTFGIFN